MDGRILHLLSQRTIVQDILSIVIYFLIFNEDMVCIVFSREPQMVET